MKKNLTLLFFLISFQFAYASGGGLEDSLANIISWLVIIVLPFAGIYLFWQAHIYPEALAEKNNHPQLQAIKTMCLLSLFVGGLLWPIAMIWATYKYPNNREAKLQVTENQPVKTERILSEEKSIIEDSIDKKN